MGCTRHCRKLFLKIPIQGFEIPEINNHYPKDFKNNTFDQEYSSFQLALNDAPKDSLINIIVICLDLYCMSGRLLHAMANGKNPSWSDLMDFKKTCLLLKDAEVSKIFYDRGIIQNTSEAIATTQTLNEKVATTKDDYIKMFYYSITRIKNTFIFFRYASCFILKLSLGAPFSRRSDISIF